MKYPNDFIDKIICGDCLEVMKDIPNKCVDLVLTSPPYNTARGVKTERGLRNLENRYIGYEDQKTNEEYILWTREVLKELERVLVKDGCILYNLSYSSENTELMWLVVADIIKETNLTIADCITWKKKSAVPNNVSHNKLTRIVEYVFVICRKSELDTFKINKKVTGQSTTGQNIYENIFNFVEAPNNDGVTETHKAAFSSVLCGKLMKLYSRESGLILDPFIGTGTTAVAAKILGQHCIGIEISPEYCKITEERLRQENLL